MWYIFPTSNLVNASWKKNNSQLTLIHSIKQETLTCLRQVRNSLVVQLTSVEYNVSIKEDKLTKDKVLMLRIIVSIIKIASLTGDFVQKQ